MLMLLPEWAKARAVHTPPPGMTVRPDAYPRPRFRFLFVVDQIDFVLKEELANLPDEVSIYEQIRSISDLPMPVGGAHVLTQTMAAKIPFLPSPKLQEHFSVFAGAVHLAKHGPDVPMPCDDEGARELLLEWYKLFSWQREYDEERHAQASKLGKLSAFQIYHLSMASHKRR